MDMGVPALYANFADHATAYAFWMGSEVGGSRSSGWPVDASTVHTFFHTSSAPRSQAIEPFIQFVDEVMSPSHDFLSVCKVTARETARQVGSPPHTLQYPMFEDTLSCEAGM